MKQSLLLIVGTLFLLVSASPARAAQWEVIVEMDGQIFPSQVLSMATMKLDPSNSPRDYLGDPIGNVGISILNPGDLTTVVIEVRAAPFIKPSKERYVLVVGGRTYKIFPYLHFDYERLKHNTSPTLARVEVAVSVDDGEFVERSRAISVRGIGECLLGFYSLDGAHQSTLRLLSAYVNEDHQWIDGILREALDTGAVTAFVGYQAGPQAVWQQVYAIWHVLQRRGFRYSNIPVTSMTSPKVQSQFVRTFEESMRTAQANCVDGSVLFASILRRIGLSPILVLLPQHCFLGVRINERDAIYLETTAMGGVNINLYPDERSFSGQLNTFFGAQTKQHASYKSFVNAIVEGSNRVLQNTSNLSRGVPPFGLIDIAQARAAGFAPINP